MSERPSTPRDKTLFTPGPLTTSLAVKTAMLRDLGSRDDEFLAVVCEVRRRLLDIAGVRREDGYEVIPMQGSGTFGVEAVLTCAAPADGKWLIVSNGAYGERMVKICQVHRIPCTPLRFAEDTPVDPAAVARELARDAALTGVAVVHCETASGLVNPIEAIGGVVRAQGRTYFVDAMSSFGGVALDLPATEADFLVSSANKCIEGVPGFSFCLCRRAALLRTEGWSRTLSLDLFDQWQALEKTGQFRFTPPVQVVLAFAQALRELEAEGGVAARAERYRRNHAVTTAGMHRLGFTAYLRPELQGHIITAFRYLDHPRFDFDDLYRRLSAQGHVIYSGKLAHTDCFRIGHIGRIFEEDCRALLLAVEQALVEQDVRPREGKA